MKVEHKPAICIFARGLTPNLFFMSLFLFCVGTKSLISHRSVMAREPMSPSVLADSRQWFSPFSSLLFPQFLSPASLIASLIPVISSPFLSPLSQPLVLPRPSLVTMSHAEPCLPHICPPAAIFYPRLRCCRFFPLIVWLAVISPSHSTMLLLCERALRPHWDTLSVPECSYWPELSPGFLKCQ